MDKDRLYKEWKLPEVELQRDKTNNLNAEIRSRIIFDEDRDCYQTAKKASDGFEHGFITLGEAHDLAATARDKTAACLRRSIFDLADLDQQTRTILLDHPFDRPLERWRMDFQFRGKLVGRANCLAADGQRHPRFEWNEGKTSATRLDDGQIRVTFSDQALTARFGNGVTCKNLNIRVFGPRRDDEPKK